MTYDHTSQNLYDVVSGEGVESGSYDWDFSIRGTATETKTTNGADETTYTVTDYNRTGTYNDHYTSGVEYVQYGEWSWWEEVDFDGGGSGTLDVTENTTVRYNRHSEQNWVQDTYRDYPGIEYTIEIIVANTSTTNSVIHQSYDVVFVVAEGGGGGWEAKRDNYVQTSSGTTTINNSYTHRESRRGTSYDEMGSEYYRDVDRTISYNSTVTGNASVSSWDKFDLNGEQIDWASYYHGSGEGHAEQTFTTTAMYYYFNGDEIDAEETETVTVTQKTEYREFNSNDVSERTYITEKGSERTEINGTETTRTPEGTDNTLGGVMIDAHEYDHVEGTTHKYTYLKSTANGEATHVWETDEKNIYVGGVGVDNELYINPPRFGGVWVPELTDGGRADLLRNAPDAPNAVVGLSYRPPDVRGEEVCFVAGTLVLMADILMKRIERIQVGDIVLARNDKDPNSPLRPRCVLEVKHNAPSATYRLVFRNEKTGREVPYQVTPEHPYFVPKRGWVAVENLELDDVCVTPQDAAMTLISKTFDAELVPVYNLEVEEDHTYFVGSDPEHCVLVHNDCVANIFEGLPQAEERQKLKEKLDKLRVYLETAI